MAKVEEIIEIADHIQFQLVAQAGILISGERILVPKLEMQPDGRSVTTYQDKIVYDVGPSLRVQGGLRGCFRYCQHSDDVSSAEAFGFHADLWNDAFSFSAGYLYMAAPLLHSGFTTQIHAGAAQLKLSNWYIEFILGGTKIDHLRNDFIDVGRFLDPKTRFTFGVGTGGRLWAFGIDFLFTAHSSENGIVSGQGTANATLGFK